MAQTSFYVDEETEKLFEQLKKDFGVSTKAQVLRKALALAKVASANSSPEHTVTIKGKDGDEKTILLQG